MWLARAPGRVARKKRNLIERGEGKEGWLERELSRKESWPKGCSMVLHGPMDGGDGVSQLITTFLIYFLVS